MEKKFVKTVFFVLSINVFYGGVPFKLLLGGAVSVSQRISRVRIPALSPLEQRMGIHLLLIWKGKPAFRS